MKNWAFVLLLLSSAQALANPSVSARLQSIYLNQQGVALLKTEKPELALQKFSEALAADPDSATLHLNMGLAFEAMGDSEKAMQAYKTAEFFAQDFESQFAARFNQGALLQKAKKVDEALEAYHKALEINPTSRETKINIELLIQDQQGQGKGDGDKKENQKDGQGQDQKNQDQQDQGDQKKDDAGEQDKPKEYQKNKPQPKPFKSEELTQSDVNKILGELRNQEQRIRSDYNKRDVKERPRDKDW